MTARLRDAPKMIDVDLHGRVALKRVRGAVGFVPAARPNLRPREF